jgi:hypothetical protein
MTPQLTPDAIDTCLAGLSLLDAFDSDDSSRLSLLHRVYADRELLLGMTAVASMLRRAVAAEAACDPSVITAQLRDDVLHCAAKRK